MRKIYYWNAETQRMEEVRPQVKEQFHYVQDDSMPDTRHPANGQIYDGKAAYRRATKERGLTEVGNEFVNKPWVKPVSKVGDTVGYLRHLFDNFGD